MLTLTVLNPEGTGKMKCITILIGNYFLLWEEECMVHGPHGFQTALPARYLTLVTLQGQEALIIIIHITPFLCVCLLIDRVFPLDFFGGNNPADVYSFTMWRFDASSAATVQPFQRHQRKRHSGNIVHRTFVRFVIFVTGK